MPEQQPIEQQAPVREAGKVNWSGFTNKSEGETITEVKNDPPPTPPEEPLIKETPPPAADPKPAEEKPTEQAPPVKTPEELATELKTEAKELGLPETATKEEVAAA